MSCYIFMLLKRHCKIVLMANSSPILFGKVVKYKIESVYSEHFLDLSSCRIVPVGTVPIKRTNRTTQTVVWRNAGRSYEPVHIAAHRSFQICNCLFSDCNFMQWYILSALFQMSHSCLNNWNSIITYFSVHSTYLWTIHVNDYVVTLNKRYVRVELVLQSQRIVTMLFRKINLPQNCHLILI